MNIDRRIRELEKEKNQITNAIHYWDDVMKDGNISYMEREETDETIISLNVSRKAIKRLLEKLKMLKSDHCGIERLEIHYFFIHFNC